MTITLQDLQVLDAKADETNEELDIVNFRDALEDYYRSGAFQRLAELADRHEHDCPTFREFFNKYALGSKLPPSCLMCGRIVHERAVEHAELPDIYICADCKQLAEDGERYRWLREHAKGAAIYLPVQTEPPFFMGLAQGEVLDAAIDSARAPSVKEGKEQALNERKET